MRDGRSVSTKMLQIFIGQISIYVGFERLIPAVAALGISLEFRMASCMELWMLLCVGSRSTLSASGGL